MCIYWRTILWCAFFAQKRIYLRKTDYLFCVDDKCTKHICTVYKVDFRNFATEINGLWGSGVKHFPKLSIVDIYV